VLRFCGIGESAVDHRLKALLRNPAPGLEYTLLAYPGLVDLRISVRESSTRKAHDRLQKIKRLIGARMETYLYGFDEDSLESVLGRRLRRLGWRLATAESCTGGLLSQSLTSVPGSSDYFLGGLVAYDNALKKQGLGVRESTLIKVGAVSETCAQEMAEGARTRYGAHVGVSITGIAGPGGGSPSKPVGLTYIGIALPQRTLVKRFLFAGDRTQVRQKAAVTALYLLWQQLN
jgi:nicotinamide-nucleotide amidase